MRVPHDDVGSIVSQPSARELPGTVLGVVKSRTIAGVSGATAGAVSTRRTQDSASERADGSGGAKQTRMSRDAAKRGGVVVVDFAWEHASAPDVFRQRHRRRGAALIVG